MFSWADYSVLLSLSFINSICTLLQPVFLSLLLSLMTHGSAQDFWWAYVYGVGICVSSLVGNVVAVHSYHISYVMSMKWKVATLGLILKRASVRGLGLGLGLGLGFCVSGVLRWANISLAHFSGRTHCYLYQCPLIITGSPG